jgi:hypothetical protein
LLFQSHHNIGVSYKASNVSNNNTM